MFHSKEYKLNKSKKITSQTYICRNISGVYTPDFPNLPPSWYNFTGDDLPTSLAVAAEGTKVKVLNFNETVEIIFQGTNLLKGSETHPMHLHGHSFYVVGSGFKNFDNETDPQGYNLIDPPKVNTFAVPKKGWITIRFTANNPGINTPCHALSLRHYLTI